GMLSSLVGQALPPANLSATAALGGHAFSLPAGAALGGACFSLPAGRKAGRPPSCARPSLSVFLMRPPRTVAQPLRLPRPDSSGRSVLVCGLPLCRAACQAAHRLATGAPGALAITQYANLERRNPMRKLFTLPLVAVALVLCTWAATPLGRISSSQPFERNGATVPVGGVASWPLFAGDVIVTHSAPATIVFRGGNRIVLEPNSELKI